MKLLLPAVITGLLAAVPALADEQRINISVSELTCPSCAYIAAGSMRSVPSVEIVDFLEGQRWDEGVFVVTYDDQAANPAMIVQAIMANGYPAEVLPAGDS
jgi:mercuric ion binding protein